MHITWIDRTFDGYVILLVPARSAPKYEHQLHKKATINGESLFSFSKMEAAIRIAEEVTADEAPDVEMPTYDERAMASIQRVGLGMYMDDTLTTANIGHVFVD